MHDDTGELEEIAPGNILQQMYLRRRLQKRIEEKGGRTLRFCDNGAGKGAVSRILLGLGMEGIGSDLEASSCMKNKKLNEDYIKDGKYEVVNESFLTHDFGEKSFDVVISSMVIAHLSPDDVDAYFDKFKNMLSQDGIIISIVPGSQKHWGIEDETVGHFKRYSFKCFDDICEKHDLVVREMCGLCYPISNWLLPLSNALINKDDRQKLDLNKQKRTELSGNRHVRFKNIFPRWTKLILNEVIMYPFYILQRIFRNHPSSLVIYSELERK
jgi:ubiquinone/menaquinone biosynthesis C-methylase UbiE